MYKIILLIGIPDRLYHKLLLIMRLTTVILIASLMQVSASTFGQSLNLQRKGITLEQVFKEIRNQTGYDILLSTNEVKVTSTIDADFNNATIEEVMDRIVSGKALTYSIEDKTILLKPKTPSFLDNLVARFSNIDVRGVVVDGESGLALAGASVKLKGTGKATTTGSDGAFYLPGVDEKDMIVVSFIGYVTQELKAKKDLGEIRLVMGKSELEEVNVTYSTGYQNIPKERATGSFEFLENKDLNRRISTDILSRIENIASGVVFHKNKQGGNSISVRGLSTITSNTDPLIVVDNFPYEGALTNINPDDVENITILKDAAAASIWGARAGNGVIVITTKKGRFNEKAKISFNSNLTVGGKPDLFYTPSLKTSDFIDMEKFLFEKGLYTSILNNTTTYPSVSPVIELLNYAKANPSSKTEIDAQIDKLHNIDNRQDLLENGYHNTLMHQYGLNLAGGSTTANYYLSTGYANTKGQFGNDGERITINSQNTVKPIKNLTLTGGIAYTMAMNKGNKYPSTRSKYPYETMLDDSGNSKSITGAYRPIFLQSTLAKGFLDWGFNPIEDAKLNDNVNRLNEARFSLGVKYELIKGLNIELNYQFQKQGSTTRNLRHQESYYTRNLINEYTQLNSAKTVITKRPVPLGAILDRSTNENTANSKRASLTYDKDLKDHTFNVLAGVEIREINTVGNGYTSYGFDPNILVSKAVNFDSTFVRYPSGSRAQIPGVPDGGSDIMDRFRSFFANGAYSFKNKYILSASARTDASNYFGVNTNQRVIPLWSVGAKWDISKETFFNLPFISHLQLKSTYGYNGNINKGLTAFTTATYGTNNLNLFQLTITTPPNPELRWERSSVLNLGLDFASKGNRVSGSIEYYQKKGLDLIARKPIDPTTGFATYTGNVANMKSKGVDVVLNTKNTIGLIKWETSILVNYNKDQVTDYFTVPSVTFMVTGDNIQPIPGNPVYSLYSYKWAGLDPANGNPRGYVNGVVSSDYTKIPGQIKAEDLIYNGPIKAPLVGAVLNSISYKGFSLLANIAYKFNYYFRRPSINYASIFSPNIDINNLYVHNDYVNRWQKPGDESLTNVPSLIYPNPSAQRDAFYNNSEVLVEKGDQIRLQDIKFSYNFNKKIFNKIQFNNIQLYAYINNIGVLWKANKKEIDPDYISVAPFPLTTSFGLSINF